MQKKDMQYGHAVPPVLILTGTYIYLSFFPLFTNINEQAHRTATLTDGTHQMLVISASLANKKGEDGKGRERNSFFWLPLHELNRNALH